MVSPRNARSSPSIVSNRVYASPPSVTMIYDTRGANSGEDARSGFTSLSCRSWRTGFIPPRAWRSLMSCEIRNSGVEMAHRHPQRLGDFSKLASAGPHVIAAARHFFRRLIDSNDVFADLT